LTATVQASTTIPEDNVGDGQGTVDSFDYSELIALILDGSPDEWIPFQSTSLFDAYPYSKLVRMNTVVGVVAIHKIIY
jgi:hypothetical protein